MTTDEYLSRKIKSIQALIDGATTPGEKAAAEAAMKRLTDKHGTPPQEVKPEPLSLFWFRYSDVNERNILISVMNNVMKTRESFFHMKKKHLGRQMTYTQMFNITSQYDYHLRAYKRKVRELSYAYSQEILSHS